MLFYNSTLSIPMLAAAVILAKEPYGVAEFPLLLNRRFQVCGHPAAPRELPQLWLLVSRSFV
jgi:hypothetical protein